MSDHASRWPRVIGIVGGLGPRAHILLERALLAAVADAAGDQDYPDWIVVSRARTPDRTEALVADGRSPLPDLVTALRWLEGRADVAVIACNTAHAWLDELRERISLPIFDLVEAAVRRCVPASTVGLLATTGTLASGVYAAAAARVTGGAAELVSLPDLDGGDRLQEELLMRSIYGRRKEGRRSGGLKAGEERDPVTGESYRDLLTRAVLELRRAGAEAVILGCTELPLAVDESSAAGVELVDPLVVAAEALVAIASGEDELPSSSIGQ